MVFKVKICGLFQHQIEMGLDDLRRCIQIVERNLKNTLEEFKTSVEEEASHYQGEEKESYYEFHSGEHWQLSDVFPNVVRASFFITCFSRLEYNLNNLCTNLQREHRYPEGLTDSKGKGIVRAKNYLKKVAKRKFPDNINEWEDILVYNIIRNVFAHNGGILNLKKGKNLKKVESYIKKYPQLITIDHLKRLTISAEFCPEVINTIEKFFSSLFKK